MAVKLVTHLWVECPHKLDRVDGATVKRESRIAKAARVGSLWVVRHRKTVRGTVGKYTTVELELIPE